MASRPRKKKSGTKAASPGWTAAGVCIGLAAMVFIVFGQTIHFDFVNYDDPAYLYENPLIFRGPLLTGIGWAFTHSLVGHWHPLTTIVFMLDCRIFGLWPGGHHLVNVIFHTAAVIFLFLLLLEMTGALWRSAFAAALFAIHPLRVESVAWISELKDVLSVAFFMLTLWAYARYVRRPGSKGRYAMMLLWFILGLLSKPMLVTIPCVLLLLDYWPLSRLRDRSQFIPLLVEKIPLFILSAISSVATIFAVKSGNEPTETYPANAPIGFAAYLWKSVCPNHLAVPYIIPKYGWPAWEVIGAILLLAALTAGAWLLRRSRPYLLTGWLWYLGMLVPVAGVMQTGYQAYADRYTYLPQIGLCFALTWLVADWAGGLPSRRTLVGTAGCAIVAILMFAAWRQTGYWQDSETLWTHALEVTSDNFVAYNSLGEALIHQGRGEEGIADCRHALRLYPNYAQAHNDIAAALLREGRSAEAMAECRAALSTYPNYPEAHYNLACALFQSGRIDEGIAECREALRLDPNYTDAHNNLGNALYKQGRIDDAMAQYRAALQTDPEDRDAHNNLANALALEGHTDEAIAQFREALRIDPTLAVTHANLANALFDEGHDDEAIAEARAALRIDPNSVLAQNSMAWILATANAPSLRDGATALQLALAANRSTGNRNPHYLRTLAAAYAQSGDFPTAMKVANAALQLVGGQLHSSIADSLRADMESYKAARPLGTKP